MNCSECKQWKHDEKDRQDAGMVLHNYKPCTLMPYGTFTHKTAKCEKYAKAAQAKEV